MRSPLGRSSATLWLFLFFPLCLCKIECWNNDDSIKTAVSGAWACSIAKDGNKTALYDGFRCGKECQEHFCCITDGCNYGTYEEKIADPDTSHCRSYDGLDLFFTMTDASKIMELGNSIVYCQTSCVRKITMENYFLTCPDTEDCEDLDENGCKIENRNGKFHQEICCCSGKDCFHEKWLPFPKAVMDHYQMTFPPKPTTTTTSTTTTTTTTTTATTTMTTTKEAETTVANTTAYSSSTSEMTSTGTITTTDSVTTTDNSTNVTETEPPSTNGTSSSEMTSMSGSTRLKTSPSVVTNRTTSPVDYGEDPEETFAPGPHGDGIEDDFDESDLEDSAVPVAFGSTLLLIAIL